MLEIGMPRFIAPAIGFYHGGRILDLSTKNCKCQDITATIGEEFTEI